MLVEQAIFTSALTDHASGYQIVAHSPGIGEADLQAISTWCPTHDSLLGSGEDAVSHNFHPLPGGAWCISRSTLAGGEYSGRGVAVYTQCLVVSAALLGRYANNPFAVLRAALASGRLEPFEEAPHVLAAFELPGRSANIDRPLLAQLARDPGPMPFARFVQTALANSAVAVAGAGDIERIFAGLFSCLPLACRLEFSFATGLKPSPRRPVRLLAVGNHPTRRQLGPDSAVELFDFSRLDSNDQTPLEGWAALVATAITCGNPALLPVENGQGERRITAAGLAQLGDQLHGQLEQDFARLSSRSTEEPGPLDSSIQDVQRADAPHARFATPSIEATATQPASASQVQRPSRMGLLSDQSPEVQELLEHLDDVVFSAIDGKSMALEQLEVIWPLVLDELGPNLMEESREQYLRYAMEIWNDCLGDEILNPAKAVSALDVLCLLFNE